MSTLIFAANSVLPIILIIFIGYRLKIKGFYDTAFLKTANKLVFRVALPCYLFYNVYSIEGFGSVNWSIVILSTLFVLVIFLIGMITICLYTKQQRKRGTLIQCTFRSNYAIIGVTLAEAMGGMQSVAVAAVISAFSIPLFNILAVICLTIFNEDVDGNDGNTFNLRKILKSICKNPLIIGVVLGIVVLAIRSIIPIGNDGMPVFTIQHNLPFLYKVIKNVGAVASPLALLVLGGQFTFSAVKMLAKDIFVGVLWRLVLAPVIGIGGILILAHMIPSISITATEMPALIALYCSPVAVSSAIMAEEMNSHGELARQLVVWTSLFSILTMFLAVVIFKSLGLV